RCEIRPTYRRDAAGRSCATCSAAAGPASPTSRREGPCDRQPRLRILLVRIGDEARIRLESVGGPFPYLADHLPTAAPAISFGKRRHVEAFQPPRVKVRLARVGWLSSPGKAPLVHGSCRQLPLGLGRQTPAGPTTPGLGLVPVDVQHGPVRF